MHVDLPEFRRQRITGLTTGNAVRFKQFQRVGPTGGVFELRSPDAWVTWEIISSIANPGGGITQGPADAVTALEGVSTNDANARHRDVRKRTYRRTGPASHALYQAQPHESVRIVAHCAYASAIPFRQRDGAEAATWQDDSGGATSTNIETYDRNARPEAFVDFLPGARAADILAAQAPVVAWFTADPADDGGTPDDTSFAAHTSVTDGPRFLQTTNTGGAPICVPSGLCRHVEVYGSASFAPRLFQMPAFLSGDTGAVLTPAATERLVMPLDPWSMLTITNPSATRPVRLRVLQTP